MNASSHASGSAASGHIAPEQLAESWARIRARLREEVGEVEYRTWLRQMTLAGIDGDEAVVLLPTRFLRDWVRGHFGDRLRLLWQQEVPGVRRVEIRVDQQGRAAAAPAGAAAPGAEAPQGLAEPLRPVGVVAAPIAAAASAAPEPQVDARTSLERLDTAAPLDPRFTFETFVVGKPNEFAHACARRKTHLMHAIASSLCEHVPGVSVAYMSAEKFMYRFIAALRSKDTMEFKESLRSVDVLMIDDVQFLVNKDNTQEEFFHTFNALVEAGKQIVISSDKAPSELDGIEARLRTRLGGGMVADIHATTYELRLSILEAKAQTAPVPVPPKVLEFLAHKITTNVRDLEGALNRLTAHAALFGRPLSLETVHEVLHDILRSQDKRVTIEEIQRKVAEHYNIRLTDMSSGRRARQVARPRQVAMYLAKQLTTRSLPEIGRRFGNRDHTTVMHAVSRISGLMAEDPGFSEEVSLLRKMLET